MKQKPSEDVKAYYVGQAVIVRTGIQRDRGIVKRVGTRRLRVEWRDYRHVVHNARLPLKRIDRIEGD